MSRFQDCKNKVMTDSGSIDFDYYDKRARQLRANAFAGAFRTFRSRASAATQVLTGSAVSSPCG